LRPALVRSGHVANFSADAYTQFLAIGGRNLFRSVHAVRSG
jgi:hypothetical protein